MCIRTTHVWNALQSSPHSITPSLSQSDYGRMSWRARWILIKLYLLPDQWYVEIAVEHPNLPHFLNHTFSFIFNLSFICPSAQTAGPSTQPRALSPTAAPLVYLVSPLLWQLDGPGRDIFEICWRKLKPNSEAVFDTLLNLQRTDMCCTVLQWAFLQRTTQNTWRQCSAV